MAWDKGLPSGQKKFREGDDDIRNNNDALEAALNKEHEFATGGNQTGIHSFPRGGTTTRDNYSAAWPNGGLWFNSVLESGHYVLQLFVSGTWFDINTLLRRVKNLWEKGNHANAYVDLGTPAGTVNLDLDDGNYFKLVAQNNLTFANPSNKPAGTTFTIEIDVDAPSLTWAWGSDYRWPRNVMPPMTVEANRFDRVHAVVASDGKIHLSTAQGYDHS